MWCCGYSDFVSLLLLMHIALTHGYTIMRALICLIVLLGLSGTPRAAEFVDSAGRHVMLPDHIARILPAGPPAAVLLLALAPDLMLGFTSDVSPEARTFLPPAAAGLPKVPRLTGKADVTEAVRALKPDLIIDYGDVTPAYTALAQATQDKLGVPVILLDGSLAKAPAVLRQLGSVLGRNSWAEELAQTGAAVLALRHGAPRTVMYLRGTSDLRAAAPGTGASEVFTLLGWQVLSPPGTGAFRGVTREQIAELDPDVLVFGDPHMRDVVAKSSDWHAMRAVRAGHAFADPARPFGWIEEPPSLNRWLGLAWMSGGASEGLMASLYAALYRLGETPPAGFAALHTEPLPQ
jgi:iron complex transport system substrate-binding protein